jgi:hypothetical protein
VKLDEKDIRQRFATDLTRADNATNLLSDRFGSLKRPARMLSIIGDDLQDESDLTAGMKYNSTANANDLPAYEHVTEEERRLNKHRRVIEQASVNMHLPIDPIPNKLLQALLNGCEKINQHHVGTKFLDSIKLGLKLVSSVESDPIVGQTVKYNLSDRFALSQKHNSEIVFSHFRELDLLRNNPQLAAYANKVESSYTSSPMNGTSKCLFFL